MELPADGLLGGAEHAARPGHRRGRRARAARRGPCQGRAAASAPRTSSSCRSSRSWRTWRRSASPSTARRWAAWPRPSRRRSRGWSRRSIDDGRPPVHARQPEAARAGALLRAEPAARAPHQDRLLDRRRRCSRTCAPAHPMIGMLLDWRAYTKLALDLRRRAAAAARPATPGGCTPPSTRRSRPPGG